MKDNFMEPKEVEKEKKMKCITMSKCKIREEKKSNTLVIAKF